MIIVVLLLLAGFATLYATFTPPSARVVITSKEGTIDYNGIEVKNYAFDPQTLSIKTGTTSTWVNENPGTIHTVTSETSLFSSGNIQPEGRFSFTFGEPGIYEYYCAIHPWMNGTVVVSDQSS